MNQMLGIILIAVMVVSDSTAESDGIYLKKDIGSTLSRDPKGDNFMQTHMLESVSSTGPFSGVSLNDLTDTPMLSRSMVFQASGHQLLAIGGGMKSSQGHDGEQVAITQEGFFIEFEAQLNAGRYAFAVQANAPDGGSDSYWLLVDGEQIDQSIAPPVGTMGKRSVAVRVTETGKHRFRLVLRESPGSVIRQVELYHTTNKMPSAPMQKELLDKHPRIFFTADDLESMKVRLKNERVRHFYTPSRVLTRKPPAFNPGGRNGGSYRGLGSYALGYLLEPDDGNLKPILEWLEMATTYPHCGVDLDAEYFIEGIALTYDWLYDYIPDDLRARVRDTIARQCRQVYEASLHGRTGGGLSFQQNHYWYAHLSLALGAAVLCGELPEAEVWLAWSWDRFERIALSFSPDGGFHEGPSYWDFSMPTLYLYTDLYEWCTGLQVSVADEGLTGQARFRFHHLYPGLSSSAALEDSGARIGQPRVSLLLWEANRFRDTAAMGMADLLESGPEWLCWNFLWLDEELESRDPLKAVALSEYYPDIETAFARTDWKDDATYLAFISRPLDGHKWAELCAEFDLGGTGHNHPAQNHFVLFGRGEVLAADPGYTYEKKTRNHNTVLIDGEGQYGDGEMWPRPTPGRARITQFVTQGDITIAVGDATSAYPESLGLTLFERTLVLAGRDLVVIYDRLVSEQARTFSWLLHHYGELSEGDDIWTVKRNSAQLGISVVLPEQFKAEVSTYRPQYIHPTRNLTPKEADIGLLELKAGPATETTFLVPLIVANVGQELLKAQDISTNTCYAIRVGGIVVAFKSREAAMTVQLPWGENFETDANVLVARLLNGEHQVVTMLKESTTHD
ncbi:DUF4962 domain-containing protein [Candidatus Poribacteria bacterium]